MPNRYAVIDLGTNTFHLLIAEQQGTTCFKELYRQRFFVKLAEEGIQTIGEKSLKRALEALENFRKVLDEFKVKKVSAIGTAALRTASNGQQLINTIKDKFDIEVTLIDGKREANLIYKGVRMAVPFEEKNYLLMDIGGGSVEFIIVNKDKVLWANSFPIGVAVLHKKFHNHEPILPLELQRLETFIDQILTPLYQALQQYPTSILVGASGTFDVLEVILAKDKTKANHALIDLKNFPPLFNLLISATKEERFAMQAIPDTRADMIVVAVVLIKFILQKADIKEIIVSNYALKEGVLSELLFEE